MRIFHGVDEATDIPRPVVTIGSFDGVHIGHREILNHIRELAHTVNGESVVITFHPHPRMVLPDGGKVQMLNTLSERLCLFEELGIDNIIIIKFTPEFGAISSRDFVKDYLVEKLHVNTLLVGYNHHFGRNKEGDYDKLLAWSREFGFALERMPQQQVKGKKVSSTVIRETIRTGRMKDVSRYLGKPFFIMTATNAEGQPETIDAGKLIPSPGKYEVKVHIGEKNRTPVCQVKASDDVCSALCTVAESRILLLDPPMPANKNIIITFG